MTYYKCKCGAVQSKSTNADNTGNQDTEYCKGCPYLLPWGEQEYIKGEGYRLKVKGYECRMSQDLEYASRFGGSVADKCTCYVASLDYEFLEQISSWIRETYPNGELSGGFSRGNIRPTDFSSNGRYRYSICCAQNKAGVAAKAALLAQFFNPDGSRKDMTPEEEEAKIKACIRNGKQKAKEAVKSSCKCLYCGNRKDCDKCCDDCIYCNTPGDGCNNFQTWEEKAQAARKRLIPAAGEDSALAEPAQSTLAPAFDYSGLDEQTATRLQNLERRALECKQRYALDMMEIVYEAHRELVPPWDEHEAHQRVVRPSDNSKHGNRGEGAFVAWCARIGVSKSTAYSLLQVQALMDDSSPEEQEVLENASAKLLYAAARPSAPAELVEQVKSGDITTHKQYQELLAEKKAAEKQVNILKSQNEYMQMVCEDEMKRAETAEKNAAALKETAGLAQTEAALARASEETMRSQYTQLIDEQNGYLTRIAELESRPIEVAIQPPGEEQLAAIRQQADEEARQKYDQLIENVTKDRKQLQARADTLAVQLRELQKESRMPGIDTVYPMCCDYARSIATFQSTFLMVGSGLAQKEFEDCAHELMDAAEELRCVLQATMDGRSRPGEKEDDPFC